MGILHRAYWVADASVNGGGTGFRHSRQTEQRGDIATDSESILRLADSQLQYERSTMQQSEGIVHFSGASKTDPQPGSTNGQWRDADWLFCRDGKWRPVEPSTFPLAYGVSARVGRLRGYGNAIVPQQAAEFIKAVLNTRR